MAGVAPHRLAVTLDHETTLRPFTTLGRKTYRHKWPKSNQILCGFKEPRVYKKSAHPVDPTYTFVTFYTSRSPLFTALGTRYIRTRGVFPIAYNSHARCFSFLATLLRLLWLMESDSTTRPAHATGRLAHDHHDVAARGLSADGLCSQAQRKAIEMAWTTPGKRTRSAAGFSLPEILITVAVFMTVAGITGVGLTTSMRAMKATSAMQQVVSQIRLARNLAVSQQRSMELQFIPPNEIRTIRWEFPNGETTLNRYFLEGNAQFHVATMVPDTPDGFGLAGANSFAGQTGRFLPDGRFADGAGAITSGNLFVAVPGQPQSQRAVTIFGGTGRVSGYNWNGTEWMEY